jgi:hypothetical protein
MNLCAVKGDEAVPAAVPVADTETKPAVVGKGSNQAANRKDRRYSRTHECNLPRGARDVVAPAAARVARAAADLEAGPEFAILLSVLSELPDREAEQVVSGQFPEDGPAALAEALRAVASRTEQVRADDILLSSPAEVVFAGRIAEVSDQFVLLVQVKDGTATMVPLWMAGAARRDRVGDFLALVADKLDGASAVVEAVPAIDIEDTPDADGFSPFGRGDARTRSITADDVRLMAGESQSLRILVPVTIDG